MKNAPRVLLVDIETAPIECFTWGMYETNVVSVINPTYMLSFAYKWLGDKHVTTHALPDYKRYRKDKLDDGKLVTDLHRLMGEADIIVAHNGDAFDIKKSNARFIVHGLPPTPPLKTFDTLKAARNHFRFDSNKLNDIGQYLGVGKKLPHTGIHLWRGCMRGDPKSWRTMRRYNAQDVRLLEAVYLKIRSWSSSHPDVRMWTDRPGCPQCHSDNIWSRGFNVAKTRKTQRLQCRDCGTWFPGKVIK